jgi:hypothetical protein
MKWNHHVPLILNVKPVRGFYIPECTLNELLSHKRNKYLLKIPNKGYRNMPYLFNGFISASDPTLVDVGGTSRGFRTNDFMIVKMNLGSSSNPHDVTRYQLYSPWFSYGATGFCWYSAESYKTSLVTYHEYAFGTPDKAVGEVGLYCENVYGNGTGLGVYIVYRYLLARAIIDPAITKYAHMLYREGWQIDFPANYTQWFIKIIGNMIWVNSNDIGTLFMDTGGLTYPVRQGAPWGGSPDVVIGSDNTPPLPTDYNLYSPITSLSNQATAIEIDTSLQECRLVRYGTYTPTSNIDLGEIGLFTNVYNVYGSTRRIMVARGVWSPKVTLVAGTTYTIGIALKFG